MNIKKHAIKKNSSQKWSIFVIIYIFNYFYIFMVKLNIENFSFTIFFLFVVFSLIKHRLTLFIMLKNLDYIYIGSNFFSKRFNFKR